MNYKLLLFFLAFLFSCQKSNLERALESAGKNRPEIEKVLTHYRKDKLKLKAAKFLIENMDTYYSINYKWLNAYYNTLDSIFTLNGNEDLTKEQDSLIAQIKKPDSFYFDSIPDIQYLSADFLIDNIDQAFEAWKSPFAKDMSFDDFCEYLLPYKVGISDYPDLWRKPFHDTYYPYVKFVLDTVCRLDSGLILQYPQIEMDGKSYQTLPEHIFDTIPEFAVCCWVNPSEYRPWARVFDLGRSTDCFVYFVPYTQDGLSRFNTVAPNFWDIAESASLPLNQQSHIAVTYSKKQISFYINGILIKRLNAPITNKDLRNNFIGKSRYPADPYFKGEIDSFRIYNRELNYAEISALAGKTKLPKLRQRLIDVVRVIRHLNNVNITLQSYLPGGYRPVQLMNLKKGSCEDYTDMGTYIFRALGIPSGIDNIPQWATRSLGHEWNIIRTDSNRIEDYSFGGYWDTIGYQMKTYEEKAAKIFRKTFAKQPNNPAMQNEYGEVLPPIFRNPCIKDVTDSYFECTDVSVQFTKTSPRKRAYSYLCNFNNHDWIPVHWGKIEDRKAVFTKMVRDIAYLPVYYGREGIQPAADPFILTQTGEIKKLIPDHSKTQTLILKRKYKPGDVPKKGELLVGSRFQVANKANFSDSLTVYVVDTVPEILYNSVNLNLKKPYRYFRYWAPLDSRGSEISEIEIYSPDSKTKLTGKVIGNKHCDAGWEAENVFDGDPLTSYQCVWGEVGWVGLDFGKPTVIDHFRFLPRNDDNFIKEGEEYELFYWENYQWNSLGKQTGTSKQYLEYANVPTNALFWLRNLTKGKEERIFTYENGQQIWW